MATMSHPPFLVANGVVGELDEKFQHSIFQLIEMKLWDRARSYIEDNPESVYLMSKDKRRLPIHELCQMASSAYNATNDDEYSYDDDDDDESHGRGLQCIDSLKSENNQICNLAKLVIDISYKLGPTKFTPPEDDDDSENDSASFEDGISTELHDSILTVKDGQKKTPLHILCEHSADTELMRTILNGSREATGEDGAPAAQELICSRDRRGCTPLHYLAYSRECPISSLRLMMDYCGTIAQIDPTICQDIDGETPLHWALEGYMSPRRIAELLRYSNQALHVKNHSGHLPFDQFVTNFITYNWQEHDIIAREAWEVMQSYLKASTGWCADSHEIWLPLHAIASANFTLPTLFIEMALHFHQEDLSKPDPNGWLPLHRACAQRTADKRATNAMLAVSLLKAYPQAAYRPTNDTKQIPLHIAVGSSKSWELISTLLTVYPSSLNMCDPVTGLWPFLSAGSQDSESIQTSFNLLRADPSILYISLRNMDSKKHVRPSKAMRELRIGG